MRSVTSKLWATSVALVVALASCSGISKPLHGTHEDLPGGNLVQLQLVTPGFGWALTDRRLVSTDDGGKTWNDLTPIDAPGNTVKGAFFSGDQTHVWCAALAGAQIRAYRSIDHGHSWRATTLGGSYADGISKLTMDFVDDRNGWIDVDRVHGSSFDTADLYRTTDGGATWTQVQLPNGEGSRVSFENAQHGFVLVGANVAYETENGGTTWTQIQTPFNSCRLGRCPDTQGTVLDLPVFLPGGTTVWRATETKTGGLRVVAEIGNGLADMSADLADPALDGAPVASSVIDAATIVYFDAHHIVEARFSRKFQSSSSPGTGLPAAVDVLSFADLTNGWARGTLPDGKLYSTSDGGKTWTKLNP